MEIPNAYTKPGKWCGPLWRIYSQCRLHGLRNNKAIFPLPSKVLTTRVVDAIGMNLTNHYVALLRHQRSKFDRDWLALDGRIPEASKNLYEYYWLIVNTRCFYWTYFKKAKEAAKKGKTLSRDDCMALCPFADYLNHADEGVS